MSLEDYNILKAMSKDQLMDLVPSEFEFKTTPWIHQLASFVASIANDNFFLALDLGTGKSKIAVDVFKYFNQIYGKQSVIILCLNVATENWINEITMHSDLTAGFIKNGTKSEKLDFLFSKDYNFKVMNFESFRSSFTDRVKNEKSKVKEVLNRTLIEKMIRTRDNGIIIDESHKIKNHESLIFALCEIISKDMRFRYNLTGTPFHKLLDIWTQFFLLDRGKTFGNNYFLFRKKYFVNKKILVKRLGYEIDNWVITSEGKEEITKKIYSNAIRYDESEIKDMPGKNYVTIKYTLSTEQRADYDRLVSDQSSAARKEFGENKSMVFRQICSGFILKTGKVYKDNPKLDSCIELISEIKDYDKIVVFHYFDMEFQLISARLDKLKIKYVFINGSQKDHWQEQVNFRDKNEIRVALVNVKSGSASINLQTARYALFYSNDSSIITRKQAVKRIHRGEIKRIRHYYDFVGNSTIEKHMQSNLVKGISVFDDVMDGTKFIKILKGE